MVVFTDKNGEYESKPVNRDDEFNITVEKEGYKFEKIGESNDFKVIIEASLALKVEDDHGNPL